jgi:hypothetical protein
MRFKTWVGRLTGLAMCVVGAACGDDDGVTDGGAGDVGAEDGATDAGIDASPIDPLDLSTYCARSAAQYYDYLVECFGFSDDSGDYVERSTARCEAAATGIAAGRIGYDGMAAARCVAESGAEDCFLSVSPACDDVLVGLVAPGGECYSGESAPSRARARRLRRSASHALPPGAQTGPRASSTWRPT